MYRRNLVNIILLSFTNDFLQGCISALPLCTVIGAINHEQANICRMIILDEVPERCVVACCSGFHFALALKQEFANVMISHCGRFERFSFVWDWRLLWFGH